MTINNHPATRGVAPIFKEREKRENLSLIAMDTKFRGPPTIDKRDVCPRISKSSRRRGEKEKKKENIRASRGSVEIETLKVVLGAKKAYVTVHCARCAQVRRHKRTPRRKKTRHPWYKTRCLVFIARCPFSRCDTTLEAVDAHPW